MIWPWVVLPIVFIVVLVVVIWKVSQKMMYFKPDEGVKPVAKGKLLEKILRLDKNVFNVVKDDDFEINWTITDKKWLGIVGKNWENYTYAAFGKIYPEEKIVRVFEKVTKSRKITGMEGVRNYSYTNKGPMINTKLTVKQYAIKTDGSIGEVMNFTFSPNEIKGVLKQVCNSNGWALQIVFSSYGLK